MPAKPTNIVPVKNMFIPGVPAVEMQLPKGQAEKLVKTGAFEFGGSNKVSEEKVELGVVAEDAMDADEGPSAPDTDEKPATVADEADEDEADEDAG